ncbi:MAG: protein translocase subunit SecD [Bacilli bacterium]|nr:protein translocase subunit SecD [Bacilli bacterium]
MKKKNNKFIFSIIIIIGLVIAMGFGFKPLLDNTRYGLDLEGGFEVLYQVTTVDDSKLTDTMVTNTYKTILKRINVLGVSEPNISIEGKDKIRIQLAGITNGDEARKILSSTANLTFRDVNDRLVMNSDVLTSGGASSKTDTDGSPAVGLSIRDKDAFYEGTLKISQMDKNLMVIWLDFDRTTDSYDKEGHLCGTSESNCLSAASVSQAFSSDVIIQGNFNQDEVNSLVDLINSGSLPTTLTEISSKTVAASFGADSLNKTFTAGIIGVIIIIITMVAIYRFVGFITSVSIILYTFLVFLLFYLIGGVLTLPGIAALVIGIGMAVDANVITYSRIKDELYDGRTLHNAFVNGNKRSLVTILDANVTILLVAIVLFIFGESSVKGFATMFILTIVTTIFVMFFVNRKILKIFVDSKKFDNKLKFFIGANPKLIPNVEKNEKKIYNPFKNLDFVFNRKLFFTFSIVTIILGFICTYVLGLNLGIDYQGGSSITIKTEESIKQSTLEKDLENLNYDVLGIETITGGYDIRINEVLDKDKVIETSHYFEDKYEATTDIGVVSNIVKQELIRNAILSVILASIGILIYLSIRYRFSYALSAIASLLHDVFIVIGIFSLLRIQIDAIFIAALLAIIGYSLNDTIICFDRIRENLMKNKNEVKTEEELKDIINVSIRGIFTRSLITSLCTLIPVTTLILFGSHEIFPFNLALFIGLIAGTYSSIFVASQLWFEIEKKKIGKAKFKKSRWHDYIDHNEIHEMKVKGINS